MSLEYPNCDAYECWYKGNMDRINEYKETTELIYNYSYIDKWSYDLSDYSTPNIILLCDVCYQNNGSFYNHCSLCNRIMVDRWLTTSSGSHFCRFCISEKSIFESLNIKETKEIKDYLEMIYLKEIGNEIDYGYLLTENIIMNPFKKEKFELYSKFIQAIDQCYNNTLLELKHNKLQKKEQKQQIITKLSNFFPSLDSDEVKSLCKKYKYDFDFQSLYMFLMYLGKE